jgi:hypothetical protein
VIIDGAAGGETKIRNYVTFPLLTLHRGKDRVRITDEILRTLLLMHDGISFGKILPKQVGYFGA